jgi:hypothetical protein
VSGALEYKGGRSAAYPAFRDRRDISRLELPVTTLATLSRHVASVATGVSPLPPLFNPNAPIALWSKQDSGPSSLCFAHSAPLPLASVTTLATPLKRCRHCREQPSPLLKFHNVTGAQCAPCACHAPV